MSRLALALLAIGFCSVVSGVLARDPENPHLSSDPMSPAPAPPEPYLLHGGAVLTAGDTIYFGGTVWAADSARWEAVIDSVWTFDTGVGSFLVQPGATYPGVDSRKQTGLHGAMEGWYGIDATYFDTGRFLRRLSSTDPRWEGDPCVGGSGGLGGLYSFWFGAFAAEADSMCFVGGRGYGNDWKACLSQEFAYAGGGLRLQFDYRTESEDGYDLLEVYVDTGGISRERIMVASGDSQDHADLNLSYRPLPFTPKPITLSFCFSADALWSDEDGLFVSDCGAFAVDNIELSGGVVHTADFEAGEDGWTAASDSEESGGDWSHLAALADFSSLPDSLGGPCTLVDSVLVFYDPSDPLYYPHPLFQSNFAATPWIDLERAGIPPDYTGMFIEFDAYSNLPLLDYIFGIARFQWYPDSCPATGTSRPSAWAGNGFYLPLGYSQACWNRLRVDYSDYIPGYAEEVRVSLGAHNECRFFGHCNGTSNTTPWYDNVRFAVYRENSFQSLIAVASPGDTIVIPPGTYLGSDGYHDIELRGKNIVLWAPAGPESTIIDCEGLGRAFLFAQGEDSTCVLDGVTIRNGMAPGSDPGGGIGIGLGGPLPHESSPTIRNCVIENSHAFVGGGLYALGGRPTILDCIIRDNTAEVGGGAYLNGADVVMHDCSVTGNHANLTGGGLYLSEGLVSDTYCSGNEAGSGGGVRLRLGGILSRTRILGNTAGSGGGVSMYGDSQLGSGGTILDSEITGNAADQGGAVHVWVDPGDPDYLWKAKVIGSTLAGNSALQGGGVYVAGGWSVELTRTISWGNDASTDGREFYVEAGGEIVTSCAAVDTLGAVGGAGTVIHALNLVDQDPFFCGSVPASLAPTTEGDYTLAAGSPCLPEASPCDSLIGALGFGCAVVSVLPPPDDEDEPPSLTAPGILAGPNPFTEELAVHYLSPSGTDPQVDIFSVDGRRVASYPLRSGSGKVLWNGKDPSGRRVASGVYLVRFTAGDLNVVRRVVRTR